MIGRHEESVVVVVVVEVSRGRPSTGVRRIVRMGLRRGGVRRGSLLRKAELPLGIVRRRVRALSS
jgi:hypothetical protein